jgi:hypothetical protein
VGLAWGDPVGTVVVVGPAPPATVAAVPGAAVAAMGLVVVTLATPEVTVTGWALATGTKAVPGEEAGTGTGATTVVGAACSRTKATGDV